ncbi:MAG: hypothetical protein WAZ44_04395 [Minisyncoccia bacterium]
MFGPMPSDVMVTGPRAVDTLREREVNQSLGYASLKDIDEYLGEFPKNGMSRLGITEEELTQWRKQYRD